MADTWQQSYAELKEYIAKNPTIEIDMSCVVLPGDVRPEFYRLFDTVRVGFIKERYPAELEKAYELSRHYGEISKAVKDDLALESIELMASVNWFLIDPINGLMRVLFDPLFGLIKGKTDMVGFEKAASAAVEDAFKDFFREGYQRWATLSLMKLMVPDRKLWRGQATDSYTDPTSEGDVIPGIRDEGVPEPEETKKLLFDKNLYCNFLVPKAVIRSTRLNTFVGFRPDFYEARRKARLVSEKMEWYNLKEINKKYAVGKMWPDMALYVNDRLEELSLIADYYQMARPDILIEFMEEGDWFAAGRMEAVKRHYDMLKPRLGSFVVCREAVPEAAFKSLEPAPAAPPAEGATEAAATQAVATAEPPDIHLLSVGYNITKLEPIVEVILQAQAKAKEVKKSEAGSTP